MGQSSFQVREWNEMGNFWFSHLCPCEFSRHENPNISRLFKMSKLALAPALGQWGAGICESIWTGLCVVPSTDPTAEHNLQHQKDTATTWSEILTSNKHIDLGREILIRWGVIVNAGEVTGVVSCDFPDDEHAAALPCAIAAIADVHPGVFLLALPQTPAYRRCSPANTTPQNEEYGHDFRENLGFLLSTVTDVPSVPTLVIWKWMVKVAGCWRFHP